MICPNCSDDEMACLMCGEVYEPAPVSDEVIERAAIEAFACDHNQMPGDSWRDLDDEERGNYRRIARAVLSAAGGRS